MRHCIVLTWLLLWASVPASMAVQIEPSSDNCRPMWEIGDWSPKYFGPIILCKGGFVDFKWRAGPYGVFQIPNLSCPSNFTGQKSDDYQFLAAASFGGSYRWILPNKTGEYFATSPQGTNCLDGQFAKVVVVDGPSSNSSQPSTYTLILFTILLAATGFL